MILAILAMLAKRSILDLQVQISRIIMAIAAKLATHSHKRPKNASLEYILRFGINNSFHVDATLDLVKQ